jgi:hypothetical protein
VTDEEVSLVDGWFAKVGPKYPIAVLKDGAFEDALNVAFFPTAAVISPDGKLVFSGSASDAHGYLSDALGDAKKGSVYPKPLVKAMKAYREGDSGKAYSEVCKAIEDTGLSEAERGFVERTKAFFETAAADALTGAKELLEEGWIWKAHKRVEPVANASPPYPCAEEAAALLKSLQETPSFEDEMRGGELYSDASAVERENDFTKAAKLYKALHKKYEQTRIGAHALDRAKEIVEKGLPGFREQCENCVDARRACAKHKEDVKL